jgi:hypothetical protein
MADTETNTLPKEGDRCLIAIDDDGEAWIIAWWPDALENPPEDPIRA